jgi:hypothetical protein
MSSSEYIWAYLGHTPNTRSKSSASAASANLAHIVKLLSEQRDIPLTYADAEIRTGRVESSRVIGSLSGWPKNT